jgi:hypothetical protein
MRILHCTAIGYGLGITGRNRTLLFFFLKMGPLGETQNKKASLAR